MPDHRLYLSIMTPAASSGAFDINLMTSEASGDITLVATITGVTASQSETNIAIAVEAQLLSSFSASGLVYDGTPVNSSMDVPSTFRVTRTEHVVCIWSQASIEYDVENDQTGCMFKTGLSPCLMTVNDAKNMSAISGVRLVDPYLGSAFTNQQIADAIEIASAEVTSSLRNNIVLSGYLNEFSTKETRRIVLRPIPLQSCDLPFVRRDNWFRFYTLPQYGTQAYNKLFSSGIIDFRYSENFVWNGQPFELGNEVRVTFVAGYPRIPIEIKRCVLQVMAKNMSEAQGVEQLGGGSMRIKFLMPKDKLYLIYQPVRRYNLAARPRG